MTLCVAPKLGEQTKAQTMVHRLVNEIGFPGLIHEGITRESLAG